MLRRCAPPLLVPAAALTLALAALTALPARAEAPMIRGEYAGTLGPLHVKLHLTAAADGTLRGTLDSPDQGANGIACTDFRLEGNTLRFSVPSVHGSWAGTVSDAGATLRGTWTQGGALPLTFRRQETFVPASVPSAVDGFWLGTLKPRRGGSLRIQIAVRSDRDGKEYCTLDSLDQATYGIDCAHVTWASPEFAFDVPAVHGRWNGSLAADGQSLGGTWDQNGALSLSFQRQGQPILPPPPFRTSQAPAMPPADAAGMQALLARDFAQALKDGALSPATHAGVVIGVMRRGARRIFAWGTAQPDSIFEIGSITKTFTGLVLAQMIEQGKVRPDEPVRRLLPPGTVEQPTGPEITLLDLVTQHSGLPRLPDNLEPADPSNPYAEYRAANLYQFLAAHGVARPVDAGYLYSNLGVGLLGQALADRAGVSYARLVREEVTVPLQLDDTVVSLSPAQQARLIQGHAADYRADRPWEFDALAGAGALRSTAADMLSYLAANLDPHNIPPGGSVAARTLAAALAESHELRADAGPNTRIAFAWHYNTQLQDYWHDGGTGGYSSFAFFNLRGGYAGVVLVNRAVNMLGANLADVLGEHISQRFAGLPAVSITE